METRALALAVVVVVALGGLGVTVTLGPDGPLSVGGDGSDGSWAADPPAPGADDEESADEDETDTWTPVAGPAVANDTASADGPSDADAGGTASDGDPFGFTVTDVADCGRRCRDVTMHLTNRRSSVAHNVTVAATIHAGNGTGGDPVWRDAARIGDVPGRVTLAATERVTVSYLEAVEAKGRGGWITVRIRIHSDAARTTITERRQVA